MQWPDSRLKRWIGVFFISLAVLIISIDNTILNVALPAIAQDLQANLIELQWIVEAYLVTFAASLLLMGNLGDRMGRKLALLIGAAWFGTCSAIASLATTPEMLIAARGLMGLGGAIILPAALSTVMVTFRDVRERSQALSVIAAVFGFGLGVGPVAGGWLIERYDWSMVFWINVPIAMLCIAGGYMTLVNTKSRVTRPPDVIGALLSMAGVFLLIYTIMEIGISGWESLQVIGGGLLAVALIGLFFLWERHTKHPMIPLRLFKNRAFNAASSVTALLSFALVGSLFFLNQFFQTVQGYSPLETGVLIVPMALAVMLGSAIASAVMDRFGGRWTIATGIMLTTLAMFTLSRTLEHDSAYSRLIVLLSLISFGIGLAMSSSTAMVLATVSNNRAGVGAALNDTIRQLGGALGIAVMGSITNTIYLAQVSRLHELPILYLLPPEARSAIDGSVHGAHVVAHQLRAQPIPGFDEFARLITDAADVAFVDGMSAALFIAAGIMALAGLVAVATLPTESHVELRVRIGEETDPVGPLLSAGD